MTMATGARLGEASSKAVFGCVGMCCVSKLPRLCVLEKAYVCDDTGVFNLFLEFKWL